MFAAATGMPLARFAVTLHQDVGMISSTLLLLWSTSHVEGQISRNKMLKRITYSSADFDLLRARVLRATRVSGRAQSAGNYNHAGSRNYACVQPRPNTLTVLAQLVGWIKDYNENHPLSDLWMRSPREFIRKLVLTSPLFGSTGTTLWRKQYMQ